MSDVIITGCKDYSESACSAAIDTIFNCFDVLQSIKPGTKVIIKANLVTMAKPEKAATTHPELLSALVKKVTELGGEAIVGDSPGGVYNRVYVDRIYATAGMGKVEKAGGKLNRNFDVSVGKCENGLVIDEFEYTSYLDDADIIINFCKLKSHGMMAMSAAVKNMFGAVPGTRKPEYHYKYPKHSDFANMLLDLCAYFSPAVSIVDAVMAMEGNGPTAGTPKLVGAVLASSDPYKLDAVCAHIIGLSRDDVPTVAESYNRGLIPESIADISTSDDVEKYVPKQFDVKPAKQTVQFYADSKTGIKKLISTGADLIFASRPAIGKNPCKGCGKCCEICPAKAMQVKNSKVRIDRQKCIRCFCCQEFCPFGVLESKQGIYSRIVGTLKNKLNKNGV